MDIHSPGATWLELAGGVFARRHTELDLTAGLVTGDSSCLVIDTRGDVDQGTELAAAVREITPLPWIVAYTHAHFDHTFGTTPFLPCDVWTADGCAAALAAHAESERSRRIESYRAEGKPHIAEALGRTTVERPDRTVTGTVQLDLGGRAAALVFGGRGHTDHDLLVHIPDAGVVFAGDLVEHGPAGFTADSFGPDNHLSEWPRTLSRILALQPRIVVPGHGAPVSLEFVAEQREKLAALVKLHKAVHTAKLSEADAVARSPYPEDVTLAALEAPYDT